MSTQGENIGYDINIPKDMNELQIGESARSQMFQLRFPLNVQNESY